MYNETGLNQWKLQPSDRFNERMRKYNPGSISYHSQNENEGANATWNLVGGTAVTLDVNLGSHKVHNGSGTDKERLGRWVFCRVRGKDNVHTRFITAYKPCKSIGLNTVWMQHTNYFREKGIQDPNPRKRFDDDLCEEIKEWMNIGDNIVLGIDMNEDVRTSELARKLKWIGLRGGVLSNHSNESPPATFNRNENRTPIDAIFVSAAVQISRSGYTPFDSPSPSAPSDGHRMMWIEIDCYSILGKDVPSSTQAITFNSINYLDPRVRKAYCIKVKNEYCHHNIFRTKKKLEKEKIKIKSKISQGLEIEEELNKYSRKYNNFQIKTRSIKLNVANKIKDVHAGKDPWSPKYKKLRIPIDLWKRITKWKKGTQTSRTIMRRLAKKAGLEWDNIKNTTLKESIIQLQNAWKDFNKQKEKFPLWRDQFNESLIAALSKEQKISIKVMKKRMEREKASRDLGRKARRIRRKKQKVPVFSVTVKEPNGNTKELHDQASMVKVLAESNKRRQQ